MTPTTRRYPRSLEEAWPDGLCGDPAVVRALLPAKRFPGPLVNVWRALRRLMWRTP